MKKPNTLIIKPLPDHIKWTDDKIYFEIKKVLNSKFENAKLEKICYENPFSENVHGSFTFQDRNTNDLYEVSYKLLNDELKIAWEEAGKNKENNLL